MAAPAISDQATKNNQRLFKRYAQIFQNPDASTYMGHAQKFSLWLSDHKAYYVAARPEIIKLLLVAQGTLRRALHIPEDFSIPFNVHDYPHHPLIPPYILLVKSVLPFENMFMEPSLIAHIHTLRDTITPRHANIAGPSHPPSSFSTSLPLSGDSQSINIAAKISPSTTSSVSLFDPDIQVIEHRSQPPTGAGGISFPDPDIQIVEQGPKPPPTMNGPPFADPDIQIIENPNPPLSAPPLSRQAPTQFSNTPPATATAPVRKVKKRKTLNLEALAQTDVQSFLPKKEATLQRLKGVDASNSQPSPSTPSTPFPNSAEPQTAPDHSVIFGKTPVPKQTAVTINAQVQPSPLPEALIGSTDSLALVNAKPTLLEQPVIAVDTAIEASSPPDVLITPDNGIGLVTNNDILAPSAETQALQIPIKEVPTSPELRVEVQDLQEANEQRKSIDHTSQPMDVDIPPQPTANNEQRHPETVQDTYSMLVEPQEVRNGPQTAAISDTVPSIVEPENGLRSPTQVVEERQQAQGLMVPVHDVAGSSSPMEISTPEPTNQLSPVPSQHADMSITETDTAPSAIEKQASVPLQPPTTSDVEMGVSLVEPKNQASPPQHVNRPSSVLITTPSQPSPISSTPTVPMVQEKAVIDTTLPEPSSMAQPKSVTPSYNGVFTSDMRVAASQKGMRERRRIHFKFDIPEPQYHRIRAWIGRSKINSLQEIQSTICLSLGCYLTKDLEELSKKDNCKTLEKQASFARSVWPSGNSLAMNVQLDGKRQDLPLAPPLQLTPDDLVDISIFLTMGKNHVELSQYEDLSQYTFVLHAHFPTQAQLKDWEEQRQKNREWDNWIKHMSRPLTINIPRKPTFA